MKTAQGTDRKLSDEQKAFYLENGYVIVEDVLERAELAALNAELHELWLARSTDSALSDEEANNIHGLGASSPRSKNLAADPRLLELIEGIVFPGISLFSAKLISKAPHQPKMVCHWHQDDAYWQHISASACRCSLWIPLQDTGRENGCLRVVPKSHKAGLISHAPRTSRTYGACRLSFAAAEDEPLGAIDCIVRAGTVLIFDDNLKHSSLGNHSSDHRRAFILTYQEAAASAGAHDFAILRPE